jgi:hypothetical protein
MSTLETASWLIGILVSYFLPLLAALIHQRHWPEELYGVIATVLAVATAFVDELIAHPDNYHWTIAGAKAAVFWLFMYFARNQSWSVQNEHDNPKALVSKLHAFPRRVPPGGRQPGHEHHEQSAA